MQDILQVSQLSLSHQRQTRELRTAIKAALSIFATSPDECIRRLQELGVVGKSPQAVTAVLFRGYSILSPAGVSKYITFGADGDQEARTKAKELTQAFLSHFPLEKATPVQALRTVLMHTRVPRGSSKCQTMLFRELSRRYVECQQSWLALAAGSPSAQRSTASEAAASTGAGDCVVPEAERSADSSNNAAPTSPRGGHRGYHDVHGFDVCSLDLETTFVLLYALFILNTDMRSMAIKHKMTREAFMRYKEDVLDLRMIPPKFFGGSYDELALQGLPLPRVPAVSRVCAAPTPQSAPPSETLAAMRPLWSNRQPSIAETAFTWLRRAIRAADERFPRPSQPSIPLYRV